MNKNLKLTLIIFVVFVIGFLSFILFSLIFGSVSDKDKIMTGVLSLLTALIPLAIKEFRDVFTSKKEIASKNFMDGLDSYDIFLYGHSGSGKTTLIQRMFTSDIEPTESTQQLDFYEIPHMFNLKKRELINIRLTDYKGQDVNQIIEAARKVDKINALIIIADIAPPYGGRKPLTEAQVIDIFKNDYTKAIQDRLKVHEKYLSEFLIQVILKEVLVRGLTDVKFFINKIDILQKLQNQEVISGTVNLENYVQNLFKETIDHLKSFCSVNNISFEVITGSVTQERSGDNLNEDNDSPQSKIKKMLNSLIQKYMTTQRFKK